MFVTWKHYCASLRRFGAIGTLQLLSSRRVFRRILPAWTTRLSVRGYPHPVHFRHATTDKYVIGEVLALEQYSELQSLSGVRTIVDAGANIGTASVYFLNHFPETTVIALEPDPGNYSLLRKNLAYYGERAVPLRRALWRSNEPLAISRGQFRDGGEWSFQVKEAEGEQSEVEGTTLSSLMTERMLDVIDILKIDIEGAEREIFENIEPSCLDRVRMIAVELHDKAAREAFAKATARFGAPTKQVGEVTIWRNPHL